MSKILVVEDSADAFQLINRTLSGSNQIEWAKTQREAAAIVGKKEFDLILLDVMLPDGDGFTLCSLLQADEKSASIPVIFLTAKNSVSDRVLGFSIGADDFISKPFDPLELKARVDAKLRKRERTLNEADNIRAGDLEINKSSQRVFVTEGGQTQQIDLTPLEFKILLMLASRPNVVVSRDEILNTVWGENIHVYTRSVDTHVSKLRKKLGAKDHYVTSVHGSGYRFVSQPEAPRVLDLGHSTLQSGNHALGLG